MKNGKCETCMTKLDSGDYHAKFQRRRLTVSEKQERKTSKVKVSSVGDCVNYLP